MRDTPDEPFGMLLLGLLQGGTTAGSDLIGLTGVDSDRGHQSQAGVPMVVVVPLKEIIGPVSGIWQGAEAVRVAGAIFKGFELGFGVRIVV